MEGAASIMKTYAKNIILIMSGGVGSRFGTDCPKQYNYMSGRLVIDYVVDACRKSSYVDEIVVVASEMYCGYIRDRFNVPAVVGGPTRPESVANGIRFIHKNYSCEKLIITNAVCPLASTEQYDKYFKLLDEYDYVLTTWKLAPALHRLDGEKVDRDDFFNVMEPDAYRFPMLYDSFDFRSLKKYIFHNMPENSRSYYCFDYPYTMKVTYPHDIQILEVLYRDIIVNPSKEKTIQVVNGYLSAGGNKTIVNWIKTVQIKMREEIAPKYTIINYVMNAQTEANIVYEAESAVHGSIIVKFTPSDFFFHKEWLYYNLASKNIMAELIDFDEEYHMLVIKTIKPGMQVRFDTQNSELRCFFDRVNENLIPLERLDGDRIVPSVMSEFEEYVAAAEKHTFEYETRKILEEKARKIYDAYFHDAPLYYLHRDLHRRNILRDGGRVRAIDPRGSVGPREFEYVIQFIIEIRENQQHTKKRFWEMFDYFKKYVDDEERYMAALFIFFVYKANDYVFQKNDNYRLAGWCLNSVQELFFDGDTDMRTPFEMPKLAQKLSDRKINS